MTSFDCLCIDCDIRIDQGLFFHANAGWESKTMRIFLFKWTAISNVEAKASAYQNAESEIRNPK